MLPLLLFFPAIILLFSLPCFVCVSEFDIQVREKKVLLSPYRSMILNFINCLQDPKFFLARPNEQIKSPWNRTFIYLKMNDIRLLWFAYQFISSLTFFLWLINFSNSHFWQCERETTTTTTTTTEMAAAAAATTEKANKKICTRKKVYILLDARCAKSLQSKSYTLYYIVYTLGKYSG